MHAKLFSIQIFPIFASNSAEGLHFSAFHYTGRTTGLALGGGARTARYARAPARRRHDTVVTHAVRLRCKICFVQFCRGVCCGVP